MVKTKKINILLFISFVLLFVVNILQSLRLQESLTYVEDMSRENLTSNMLLLKCLLVINNCANVTERQKVVIDSLSQENEFLKKKDERLLNSNIESLYNGSKHML